MVSIVKADCRLRREDSKKECINDGVGQYDSVHHASLSTEGLLFQRVKARETQYNSFLYTEPSDHPCIQTQAGSSQRFSFGE